MFNKPMQAFQNVAATGTATVSFSSPTAGPALVTASGSTANGAVSAQLPVNVVATTPASLVLQASDAFRFRPATRVENACATGSAAVHQGITEIEARRARIVLVVIGVGLAVLALRGRLG